MCGPGARRIRGSTESLNSMSICWNVAMVCDLTREVVRYFLPKLAAQHRINVWVRGLGEVGLGKRGHNPISLYTPWKSVLSRTQRIVGVFTGEKKGSGWCTPCTADGDIADGVPHGGACCLVMCRHEDISESFAAVRNDKLIGSG